MGCRKGEDWDRRGRQEVYALSEGEVEVEEGEEFFRGRWQK